MAKPLTAPFGLGTRVRVRRGGERGVVRAVHLDGGGWSATVELGEGAGLRWVEFVASELARVESAAPSGGGGFEGPRIGVRMDEEQILLLLELLAPAGGGYHGSPARHRLQADLSIWLGVLREKAARERGE